MGQRERLRAGAGLAERPTIKSSDAALRPDARRVALQHVQRALLVVRDGIAVEQRTIEVVGARPTKQTTLAKSVAQSGSWSFLPQRPRHHNAKNWEVNRDFLAKMRPPFIGILGPPILFWLPSSSASSDKARYASGVTCSFVKATSENQASASTYNTESGGC